MPAVAPCRTQNRVHVVYNPSDSVPRGWYRIEAAGRLRADAIVLTRLPEDVAALAAQRGYLPAGVALLKRVGAAASQHVCVRGSVVSVDGVHVADARLTDGRGRALQAWRQCRTLSDGELFLLSSTNPASFDSRYFGPVTVAAVIGEARPLWTWGSR